MEQLPADRAPRTGGSKGRRQALINARESGLLATLLKSRGRSRLAARSAWSWPFVVQRAPRSPTLARLEFAAKYNDSDGTGKLSSSARGLFHKSGNVPGRFGFHS